MGVLLARSSRTLCGLPSLSHDAPKKAQFLPPCCSKYFCLSQLGDFFGCVRRAHCRRQMKMALSTREKTRLLTTADDNWTIGPASYFGIEPLNQIGGRHIQRSLDVSAGYHPERSCYSFWTASHCSRWRIAGSNGDDAFLLPSGL